VGIFPFALVVADESRLSVTRHFVLVVQGSQFSGGSDLLPPASPGVPYGPVALTSGSGSTPLVWSLYSGELPPGLTIGAAGTIAGTVPLSAEERAYSFVAALSTTPGGLALLPASIQVVGPATKSGGCSTASGDLGVVALAMGLLLLRRRRSGA